MIHPVAALQLVEPYLPVFHEGALSYASANGTTPEDVALLAAICLRESAAGRALRPRGSPDGTGDWTARLGGWLAREGVEIVTTLPVGWSAPKRNGQVLPGPYAIPRDRLGWGRGLFQIDILGDFAHLVRPPVWPVDHQVLAACSMLALARRQLEDLADHPLHERAVVARYNASLARVRTGLQAGNPDIGTTGGDYGRDVLATRDGLRSRFPERFPAPRGRTEVA